MKNTIPKIKDRQFRELTIERDAINADDRTVTLAFSSENPVERYFGEEILDHSTSSVRLGRLTDGGPLLLNHDSDCQIGVVESVEIGADRVGRAVVRFGKSDHADEIFNDVKDGIRRKVSVGYQIHKMILDGRKDGVETYRAIDWEPLEVSIVSIPADTSVGVGRSIDEPIPTQKEIRMEQETLASVAPAAPAVDVRAIQQDARKTELARINDLEKIGNQFDMFGGKELARKFIAEGKSVDELNSAILERAGQAKPVEGAAAIGMSEKELRQYSFLRVMNALANPQDKRAQADAGYELEVSAAAAAKSGREVRGIMIPYDVLSAPQRRDLTVGSAAGGGYSVATDLESGSFIDILRNRMVMRTLGATVMNGLVGNIAIPRQTGAATAYWVAESGSPTESQQTLDQVTMSPKTVGAYTDYSRKLLLQSSIDVENFVRNDLTQILALEIDRVALYGTGSSNQPTGVKNTAGVLTSDFAANTPTFAEVVGLETLVAAQNADLGTLAYLTNASMRGALKTAPKVSGYPTFIWENGELNGYRTEVSNQVASNDLFYGNWADLLVGFWSGLDLMVDPYTGSTSGTVRIVALQDVDVALRRPVSFVRGNNTL
jgi:HK97 family phage major capsid protein/HK97 family phage prohead protease